MENPKYQLPEETLMEFIYFKRNVSQMGSLFPIDEKEILALVKKVLEKDKEEDNQYYYHWTTIALFKLLGEHLPFFFPNSEDQSRINQMIKGADPRFIKPGEIPQARLFTEDELLKGVNWITEDDIQDLVRYDRFEVDITEVFWEAVQKAFNHQIYDLLWLERQKDSMIPELGYDNIRDFMEDIANPDYDQHKVDREVREFIINHITG